METKAQTSETKVSKKNAKGAAKHVSIRVTATTKKLAKSLRDEANKKLVGRTIMMDEIYELAVSLVTPAHLKMLQDKSLTHDDRKELLRQKYVELHGPISKDDWTGFTMSKAFHEFLELQSVKQVAA